jgi:hypothetical protein
MTTSACLSQVLGWAEEEVLDLAKSVPGLALQLLTAPQHRLHLVAFVLAVGNGSARSALVRDALTLPVRDVLAELGLSKIKGLRRVLGRIRGRVLDREHYRRVTSLLSEPRTAHVLHHVSDVTPELVDNLSGLPLSLRTHAIVDAIGHLPNAATYLVQWTEVLASRLSVTSVTVVQEKIGGGSNLSELRTNVSKLLDTLPALQSPPPKVIAHALRIDAPSEIRRLGRQFNNCLEGFSDTEPNGSNHIYHWRCDQAAAVCEVTRFGNLGWFLANHLGAANEPLDDQIAATVRMAFQSVGIHELKIAEICDDLIHASGRRNRARLRDIALRARPDTGEVT